MVARESDIRQPILGSGSGEEPLTLLAVIMGYMLHLYAGVDTLLLVENTNTHPADRSVQPHCCKSSKMPYLNRMIPKNVKSLPKSPEGSLQGKVIIITGANSGELLVNYRFLRRTYMAMCET